MDTVKKFSLSDIYGLYLPNATVMWPIAPFVPTINNRSSKIRQRSGGKLADGNATIQSCRQIAGMQNKFICCWLREAAGLLFHVHLLLSEREKCNPFTNGGWLLVRGLVPVWFCFAFKFHQPTYCKKAYVIWNESTRSCCLNEKMTYLSK